MPLPNFLSIVQIHHVISMMSKIKDKSTPLRNKSVYQAALCILLLFIHHAVATANFNQTDWSGGAATESASDTLNQTGWDKFFSAAPETDIVNAGADVQIVTIPDAQTHTTNKDFLNKPYNYRYHHNSTSDFSAGGTFNGTQVGINQILLTPTSLAPNSWLREASMDGPGIGSSNVHSTFFLVDIDGDGLLDLYRGHAFGRVDSYKNIGTASAPVWSGRNWGFNTGIGSRSAPTLADLDGDNKIDLIVGLNGTIRSFKNVGMDNIPVWSETTDWNLASLSNNGFIRPAFADLDNDGDLDLLIGVTGALLAYRNDGDANTPVWVDNSASWGIATLSGLYSPAIGDMDGDGDLDLMIGNSIYVIGFENTGTPVAPTWVENTDWRTTQSAGATDAAPTLGDLDGDSDLDLLIGHRNGGSPVFLNTGTRYAPASNYDYTSSVMDVGYHTGFLELLIESSEPVGTSLLVEFRAGNTANPDQSWANWQTMPANGDISSLLTTGRYFQYRLTLSTTDPSVSPRLFSISVSVDSNPSLDNIAVVNNTLELDKVLNPNLIGNYSPSRGSHTSVFPKGDYAYLVLDTGNSTSRLHVIDVSNPNSPTSVYNMGFGSRIYDVYIDGNYAYVAATNTGMVILDMTNPARPVAIKTVPSLGWAQRLQIVDGYAYVVGNASGGLNIIDVRDPANASVVGSYDTPGNASDIFVENNFAYVNDGNSGVQVFNISDKSNPIIAGNLGIHSKIVVQEHYAFTSGTAGLRLLDISDLDNVRVIYTDAGGANTLHLSGSYLYASEGENIKIFNVRDITAPQLVASYPSGQTANTDLWVEGKYLFISYSLGMNIIDLGDFNITSNGIFTSSIIDVGPHTGFTNLEFTTSDPANTTLAVRSGMVPSPELGGWTAWETINNSGDTVLNQANNRYVQYRATLTSGDVSVSPSLENVTINYQRYAFTTRLISSPFNTESAVNLIDTLSWSENLDSGANIQISLRTAPDIAGSPGSWTAWLGPSGTPESYWDSANTFAGNCSGSNAITCTSLPPVFRDTLGDQWLQYQVTLTSTGGNTPTLSEISLNYTDGQTSGINVSQTTLSTSEGTLNPTVISISLDNQPTDDVTLSFYSSDETEGTVSPSSITFTNADWSPRSVTITPVNDDIDDDEQNYLIITTASTSADSRYHNINPPDIQVSNSDDDVAGINVSPTSGLQTSESSGTAVFSITLNSQPVQPVTINLASSLPSEGTVSLPAVTFTENTWNVPQLLTITGVDDTDIDGNINYLIATSPALSSDLKYAGIDPADVAVTNIDNDSAGLIISPSDTLTTSENGGIATFTVALSSQPTASVLLTLQNTDNTEGTLLPASFTFNADNWNIPQTSAIYGRNDQEIDGDVTYQIVTNPLLSGDANFNNINPPDLSVTNLDNDGYVITVSPTRTLITQEGGGASFTIKLGTQPTAPVTIQLTSTDVTEGTVPTELVFTADDIAWRGKTVTIDAIDDGVRDGDVHYTIVTSASSSLDPNFDNIDPMDITVINKDRSYTRTTVLHSKIAIINSIFSRAANFGTGLASGNLNGDAFPDIVVGAPGINNNRGQIQVFYGTAQGYVNTPDLIINGVGNEEAGKSVVIGDINGDSIDDLVYTGQFYDGGGMTNIGRTLIHYGTNTGISLSPDWSYVGDVQFAKLGSNLSLSDVNNDGFMDVFISQPGYTSTNNTTGGRLLGFYGSPSGVANTPNWTAEPPSGAYRTAFYGRSASAGDVNNDGFNDLLVSSFQYQSTSSDAETYEGKVWLYYGSATGLSAVHGWEYESNKRLVNLGIGLSTAGDLNQDGYDDFAIIGREFDNGQTIEGGLYVFYGSNSGPALIPDWIKDGSTEWRPHSEWLSESSMQATDMNGDGYSDLIVRAIDSTNNSKLLIFYGSATGVSDSNVATFGDPTSDSYGNIFDISSDLNNDGTTDIIIGSRSATVTHEKEGAVYIYTSTPTATAPAIKITETDNLVTDENSGTASFSVVLQTPPSVNVTIPVNSSDATEGSVSTSSLVFTPLNWYLPQTVTIIGIDDNIDDNDIIYAINLGPTISGDNNYNAITPPSIPVTNKNKDRTISASVTNGTISEGNANPAIITLSSSNNGSPLGVPVTINYTLTGSASPGADYLPLSGSATIAAGQNTIDIEIKAIDDVMVEGSETVVLTLDSSAEYILGTNSSATVSINDNDAAGINVSTSTTLTTTEAGGSASFFVALSSQPSGNVELPISTSNLEGGVIPNSLLFTPSNWSVWQSVTVVGADDSVVDGDKNYSVRIGPAISGADSNYNGLSASDVNVVNIDDDAASNANLTISALNANISEGSTTPGRFRISRTGNIANDLTVNFITSGSALSGSDYQALGTSIVLPGGSRSIDLSVTGIDDALPEVSETIIVSLQPGSGYVVDQPNAATLSILDDESLVAAKVNFTMDTSIHEGSDITLTAILDKPATTYPVTVPFTVSGSALNPDDHNATAGSLIINTGLTASRVFTSVSDSTVEENETIVFAMGTPSNAEQGSRTTHTVTITELNLAATVDIASEQNGSNTRLIVTNNGEVTLSAEVNDPNPSDTHTYDWSLTNNNLVDNNLDTDPSTFVFDPSVLLPGFYKVVLIVSDDGTPALDARVEVLLEITNTPPPLSTTDSDGDGLTDEQESYNDSDRDGIADYKDSNNLQAHELQALDGVSGSYIMRTEPGLALRLGQVAFAASGSGAEVSLEDIANFGAGEATAGTDPNDGIPNTGGFFDYEIWGLEQAGQSVLLVVPQFNAIPSGTIYRKYFSDIGWKNFIENSKNQLYSSAGNPGECPPPGDVSYTSGLTAGHYCIQLLIEDGGPNDTDLLANHVVTDPGTLSIIEQNGENNTAIRADNNHGGGGLLQWPLVSLLLLHFLGFLRLRQRLSHSLVQ